MNMMIQPWAVAALCVGALDAFAVPSVSNVAVSQLPTRRVEVSYYLASAAVGDAAVVTVEFLTNGVRLADSCVRTLTGDVNRVVPVAGGRKTLWWHPRKDWPDQYVPKDFSARVIAWATNAPPQVMVLDLKMQKGVAFYPSIASLPEPDGISNIVYKTDKMAFRRIPAGGVTFNMGAPKETGNTNTLAAETPHYVQFNEDYYMAVYPLTERQFQWVNYDGGSLGTLPSKCDFKDETVYPDCAQYPCGGLSYDTFRSNGAEKVWPQGGHKTVGRWTVTGRLRAKFGVEVDLPTEAQWEYACRAETDTSLNTGVNISSTTICDEMSAAGWYVGNADGRLHPVGLKPANAWGLFDIHGGVHEFVLDWYDATYYNTLDATTQIVDPRGPTSASDNKRVMRGGSFASNAQDCRAGARLASTSANAWNATGGRLCCPGFVWIMSDDELAE